MIRAAIYARFSSDNQREESITAQLRACREHCRRNGYLVVAEYTDEARSALTDDRPGFQRMVEDAKRRAWDVLVVHKLDRFARNKYDAVRYKLELRKAGVRLESVLEPISDTPEGGLLETVLEGLAQYYSENLAREVIKGMRETALQGRHCGGRPPLGYDVADGRYVVNEVEARAVRLIFEMAAAGHGYDAIIKELNRRGYRTKRGKPFGKNSLHDILVNEKYIGVLVWNRAAAKAPDGRRNHHRSKPDDQIVRIEGAVPAIIDRDLWERVSRRMQERKRPGGRARNKAKVVYLLAGLIFCGKCAAAYVGNKSGRYAYYECNNRDRTKKCQGRRVPKAATEAYVLEEIEKKLFDPEARLVDRVLEHYESTKTDRAAELEALEREIARLRQQIDRMVDAVEEGRATKALLDRLADREGQLEALKERAEYLRRCAPETGLVTRERVEHYLNVLREKFQKKKDEQLLRLLVAEVVEKVVVLDEELGIYFRIDFGFPGGGGPYRAESKIPLPPRHSRMAASNRHSGHRPSSSHCNSSPQPGQ